jgi:hypothetical protein
MYSFCVAEFETPVMRASGIVFGHPEGERAPAAAEFEDALAIGEPGALAGEGEHLLLGGGERVDTLPGQKAELYLRRGPSTS